MNVAVCALMDLDMTYAFERVPYARSVLMRLSATNLFDAKYIAAINTADDALAATKSAATYQTGAPFGIYAGVELMF